MVAFDTLPLAQAVNAIRSSHEVGLAKELSSGKRLYYVVPPTLLPKILKKNGYLNEIIPHGVRVKAYLDIDDVVSPSEEASQKNVDNLVKDWQSYFNHDEAPCMITAHGPIKNAYKFSYTLIWTHAYFNSNAEQRVAMAQFIKKYSQYANILDTGVYNGNANLRLVNQTKFRQTRVNVLRTKHELTDTVITLPVENAVCLTTDELVKEADHIAALRERKGAEIDNGFKSKAHDLVRNILENLPSDLNKDYHNWWHVTKFIKKYGDYELFDWYCRQNGDKYNPTQNMTIWDTTDPRFCSISHLTSNIRDPEVVEKIKWLVKIEKAFPVESRSMAVERYGILSSQQQV